MGATVNPFAEMDHPFARLITPHVTDVRSKPGGLHFLENFPEGNPPQPLVVPADVYDAVFTRTHGTLALMVRCRT